MTERRARYITSKVWENEFARQAEFAGLELVREFMFHPVRRWRADFAAPDNHILIEIEGGIWTRVRHVRPAGYQADCIKYNEAALLGYRVLRFTPAMIEDGSALKYTEMALQNGR